MPGDSMGMGGGYRSAAMSRRPGQLRLETEMRVDLPNRRHVKAVTLLVATVAQEAICTGGRQGAELSWAMQELQLPLLQFLRLAFAAVLRQEKPNATTPGTGKLEYGGMVERYVELWVAVTCPNIEQGRLGWYVQAALLFYTVVLVDFVRAVRAVLGNVYAVWGEQRAVQHQMLHCIIDRFFDTFQVPAPAPAPPPPIPRRSRDPQAAARAGAHLGQAARRRPGPPGGPPRPGPRLPAALRRRARPAPRPAPAPLAAAARRGP